MRKNLYLTVGLFLLLACTGANGYAAYFHGRSVASSCFAHPSTPVGGHLPPAVDPSTTIKVTLNGKPVAGLCPGETYDISVAFGGPAARAALLTVSQGTLVQSNVPRCANAMTSPEKQLVKSLTASWHVTCSMLGGVEIKVTSGSSSTGRLHKAQTGLPVLRLSQCPNNKCLPPAAAPTPTAAVTAAKPAPGPAPLTVVPGPKPISVAAPVKYAPADPPAAVLLASQNSDTKPAAPTARSASTSVLSTISAAAPSTLSLINSACSSPSKLGYQCSKQVKEGVTLHYSLGSSPPDNACTRKSVYDKAVVGGSKGGVMHFAIESDLDGYVGLGFPTRPGRMIPADAVIGSVEAKTGVTKVMSYRLLAPSAAGIEPAEGWATGLGAVRKVNLTSNSHTTTVCFSRAVNNNKALTANLNPAVVPLIYAASDSIVYRKHKVEGSLVVDMVSGKYSSTSSTSNQSSAAAIAHGALMAAAFFLLMPAAVLVARHKWLFGDSVAGRLPASWRHLHQMLQGLAFICIIASFILAMVLFFAENGTGQLLHKLYTPHFALGVVVVGLSVLQIGSGFVNPGVGSRHVGTWRTCHYSLGWATMLAGIVNCILGVLLLHDLEEASLAVWLAPMCTVLGVLGLAGLVLEVPKATLQRNGRYSPRSLTYRGADLEGHGKARCSSFTGPDDDTEQEADNTGN